MKNTIKQLSVGLLLSLPLLANAFELNSSKGELKLEKAPKQIVTYDLAILDTLHVLGVPVVGVPKSTYEGDLKPYQKTAVVGSLFEPDYEALQKVKPDLIFAGGRSEKAVPELQKMAPVAGYNVEANNFFNSFAKNNLDLAKAFKKEKKAQVYVDAIKNNINQLHRVNKGKTAVFLFVINDNIMVHTLDDRFGYVYEVTGLTPVLSKADMPEMPQGRPAPGSEEAKQAQLARVKVLEQVVEKNPDWLLVLDRGAINGAEKTAQATLAKHEGLSQTRAFKEGRVVYLEPNPWYVISGGLSNMKNITTDLVKQMQ